MASVDNSVYRILQKYIDLNENEAGLFMIFSGSTVGLMKKLFSDSKQPLYGRLKRKMPLKPLMFRDTLEVCKTLGIRDIEEAVRLYAIFGGFPKYYVTIEDERLGNTCFEKIMDRLFYKDLSSYKRREGVMINKIKENTNAYIGVRFEAVCREFLISQRLNFEKTGRWWGAYRDVETDKRKIAEIDMVSINEHAKEILFCECKWQDKVDAKKILAEMKEKTKFVDWNRDKRKEHYAIFAKSFKGKIKEPDLMLFDLKDFEKAMKHNIVESKE